MLSAMGSGICWRHGNERMRHVAHATVFVLLVIGILMFSSLFSKRIAAQEYRPLDQVPAAWSAFAQTLRHEIEVVLRSDNDVARNFQNALAKMKAAGGGKPAPQLTVRVWVKTDGSVEYVSFPRLTDPIAEVDLRSLLLGVTVTSPPKTMLQPIQLKLSLEPRT